VNLLVLLAIGIGVYFVWSRSAAIRAGGWRVGAGLAAAALIVTGAAAAIKGNELIGLLLAATGLVVALSGRIGRRGQQRAPVESMSSAEARSILGVNEDASAAEIKAAYMRLMKRNHPDQGGTSGLAAKLNAARELLLRKG
jgi:hypothetical protein